ncbi:MAG: hypothetical protein FJ029_13045 [Actinobacteria bacterium]|nr:hypothetical protein [Actinomycetota bacterium]
METPFEPEAIVLARAVRRVWPDARMLGGPNLGFRVGIPGDPPLFLSSRHFTTCHAWKEAWLKAGAVLSDRGG